MFLCWLGFPATTDGIFGFSVTFFRLTCLFLFMVGLLFSFFDFFYLVLFLVCFVFSLFFKSSPFSFGGLVFFDGLRFFLVFLSVWIYAFCVLSSILDKWTEEGFFSFSCFLGGIFLFVFLSFSCFRIILFYLFFEFTFLLMFFFVVGWGYRIERMQASFYIVFYTLVVSFPFLVFLVCLGAGSGSISFFSFSSFSNYWWFFLLLVFLVKLPVYGVHL